MRRSAAQLELSAISISEIAIKQLNGKLNLQREDVLAGIADLNVRVLPYTSDHAFRLFNVPLHHRDPFDRQIIAQALAEEINIVSPDGHFQLYDGLKVIW